MSLQVILNWKSLRSCAAHVHFWNTWHFYEEPLAFERKKWTLSTELSGTAIHREIQKWCYSHIYSTIRNLSASSQEQRWSPEPMSQPGWAEKSLPSWSRGSAQWQASSTHLRPGPDLLCSSVNQQELPPLQWKPSGFMPEQLKLEACPKWAGAHYKTK